MLSNDQHHIGPISRQLHFSSKHTSSAPLTYPQVHSSVYVYNNPPLVLQESVMNPFQSLKSILILSSNPRRSMPRSPKTSLSLVSEPKYFRPCKLCMITIAVMRAKSPAHLTIFIHNIIVISGEENIELKRFLMTLPNFLRSPVTCLFRRTDAVSLNTLSLSTLSIGLLFRYGDRLGGFIATQDQTGKFTETLF